MAFHILAHCLVVSVRMLERVQVKLVNGGLFSIHLEALTKDGNVRRISMSNIKSSKGEDKVGLL